MGDPKKIRAKYSGPSHPWQRVRMEEERVLIQEFGLKNKKEIWKSASKLRNLKKQIKTLVTKEPTQRALEEKQIVDKLVRLGVIPKDSSREKVLELTNKDILGRRLQTIVFNKGYSRTIKQARQLITHGHVFVNGKKVDIPSYLVLLGEENNIVYSPNSQFNDEMHPERQRILAKDKPTAEEEIVLKVKKDNLETEEEKEVQEIEKAVEEAEAKKEVELPVEETEDIVEENKE